MTFESIHALVPVTLAAGLLLLLLALIYFAIQFRLAIRAIRSHSAQLRIDGSASLFEKIFAEEELAEFVFRGQDHTESLSQSEQLRWHCLMLTAYRQWDNSLACFRNRMLDEQMWLGYDRTMSSWLLHKGWREWFEKNGRLFSEGLQDHVQDKIDQLKAKPAYRLD